nr:hypothetical protein HmN_000628700 [Hymenolepis microstoma]
MEKSLPRVLFHQLFKKQTNVAPYLLLILTRKITRGSTNCDAIPGKKTPTKIPIFPVNGPHICPLCPDKRSYKFDSSLRKHLRLYHPNYKRKTSATQRLREHQEERRGVETASDPTEKTDVIFAIIWSILVLKYPVLIPAVSVVFAMEFWKLLRAEGGQSEEKTKMALSKVQCAKLSNKYEVITAVDEAVFTDDPEIGKSISSVLLKVYIVKPKEGNGAGHRIRWVFSISSCHIGGILVERTLIFCEGVSPDNRARYTVQILQQFGFLTSRLCWRVPLSTASPLFGL